MTLWHRFVQWVTRRRHGRPSAPFKDQLREFVYLDEVSVYSLLASRRGGIATEFTESQTASLNAEVGGGVGVTGAGFGASVSSSQAQGSQVLRKATIQTSFKELYDIEQEGLALSCTPLEPAPSIETLAKLEEWFSRRRGHPWVVDPSAIGRGELFEVEVQIEPEPIFRAVAIISTISKIIEENTVLFDQADLPQLAMTRAVTQVLDSLLAGLVPIRGRLLEYQALTLDGQQVLVHKSIIDGLKRAEELTLHPVFVVGVTEGGSFWKDVRTVVFSAGRHTMFCRLAESSLAETWRPLKIVEMLASVAPQLSVAIDEFGRVSVPAMRDAAERAADSPPAADSKPLLALWQYVASFSAHHDRAPSADSIVAIAKAAPPQDDWLTTVDGRRAVFGEVTRLLEEEFGTETSGDVVYELREQALAAAGLPLLPNGPRPSVAAEPSPEMSRSERFLEAEIVAIYW